jgi:hypothetical protein
MGPVVVIATALAGTFTVVAVTCLFLQHERSAGDCDPAPCFDVIRYLSDLMQQLDHRLLLVYQAPGHSGVLH